jgi:hypothetical protein
MNGSREEAEALRRIEELLASAQNAEPPQAVAQQLTEQREQIPIDPEGIRQAEANAGNTENVLATMNGILQQILVELQGLSNTVSQLAD